MAALASTPTSARSKRRRYNPDSVPTITIDDDNDDDVVVLLDVKNQNHNAAKTAPIDLNLAFELQTQEAIAASNSATAGDFAAAANLFAEDIDRLGRRQSNRRPCKAPMRSEIIVIPDEDDCYEIPYNSRHAIGGECFSLFFKGLVAKDSKSKAKFGAIGLAIFDSMDVEMMKKSEPLILSEVEMREEVAQLEAFVHGLEFAWSLDMRIVKCASLDFDFDAYLNKNQKPKDAKVAELVERAIILKKRFQRCRLSKNEKNAQLVLELARSSIASQAGRPFEEVIRIEEKCLICLEDVDSKKMIEIGSCQHRFCSSCMQKHVELKVRGRELPRCPQPNCGLDLTVDACKKFLTPKMYDILVMLVKESLIPTTEKVYCPNPRCSNLMSKTEALANDQSLASTSKAELTPCKCSKCNKLFCINCKVLWHSKESCDEYKKREMGPKSADGQLKRLAGKKKWRQCPKCSHMVELAHGCYHISCRCGHEFCYVCGCEWKNKKATCSCPLWTEENIIHQGAFGAHGVFGAQIAHVAQVAVARVAQIAHGAHGFFVAYGAPGAPGAPGAHGAHGVHGGINMQHFYYN